MSAAARGLALEIPPWYDVQFADTSLTLGLGMRYASGDTQAVVFPVALSPLQRGPLRFALAWSYASVRTRRSQAFGPGDPKLFARLRLFGSEAFAVRVEGSARLPFADSGLFPYASGAQEVELGGNLGVPGWLGLVAGAGRIWSEPPSHSTLGQRDVPHSTHLWAALSRTQGSFAVAVRGDGLVFSRGGSRRIVEASLAHLEPHGLHVELAAGFELGPTVDRVFDQQASLRFAAPLR
jgi:hypothetical protein